MLLLLLALFAPLVAAFAFASSTVGPAQRSTARPAATIRVTAFQFGWRFDYGGGAVVSGTHRRPPVAVVPARVPVRFVLGSRDVVHSFWVPPIGKADALPGRTTTFTAVFPRSGAVVGRCAEFCGLHHAEMRFRVRAVEPLRFRRWLRERRRR